MIGKDELSHKHLQFATPAQAKVLKGWLENGRNDTETGLHLGIKRQSVDSALKAIRRKASIGVTKEHKKWGTLNQRQAIDGVLKHCSVPEAAGELCITPGELRSHLSEVKRKAARAGWAPAEDVNHVIPDGYFVHGVSTYYGKNGQKRGQWVKTRKEEEHRLELLLDAIERRFHDVTPIEPVEAPKDSEDDLICVYPMGDPHIGMLAWGLETGNDFDLKIARDLAVGAVQNLVARAPAAKHAIFANMGDFFHSDNNSGRTARSGNVLDVDGRWAKVLQIGVEIAENIVDEALKKHEHLTVYNVIGNHDDHMAVVLSAIMAKTYRNEPRVHIETSPSPFYYHTFGKCLLGFTHGCLPLERLHEVMAAEQDGNLWGASSHRHWYTGHRHQDKVTEKAGLTIEVLRTLAPKDAWAHREGFRSARDMKVDVWHRERGRIERHFVTAQEITGEYP